MGYFVSVASPEERSVRVWLYTKMATNGALSTDVWITGERGNRRRRGALQLKGRLGAGGSFRQKDKKNHWSLSLNAALQISLRISHLLYLLRTEWQVQLHSAGLQKLLPQIYRRYTQNIAAWYHCVRLKFISKRLDIMADITVCDAYSLWPSCCAGSVKHIGEKFGLSRVRFSEAGISSPQISQSVSHTSNPLNLSVKDIPVGKLPAIRSAKLEALPESLSCHFL